MFTINFFYFLNKKRAEIIFIFSIACVLSYMNWGLINGFESDELRRLHEASRWAYGDRPYVDFSWQYPPLSLWLIGLSFKFFGHTVTSAQYVYLLASFLYTFCLWNICRMLFSPFIRIPLIVLFMGGTAFNYGPYGLFSIASFNPATAWASCGILCTLYGVLYFLKTKKNSYTAFLWTFIGSNTALLAKQESLIPISMILFIYMAFVYSFSSKQNRLKKCAASIFYGFMCIFPCVITYAFLYKLYGSNLTKGLAGYGLLENACYVSFWFSLRGLITVVLSISTFILIFLQPSHLTKKTIPIVFSLFGIFLYAFYINSIHHKTVSFFSMLGELSQLHIIAYAGIISSCVFLFSCLLKKNTFFYINYKNTDLILISLTSLLSCSRITFSCSLADCFYLPPSISFAPLLIALFLHTKRHYEETQKTHNKDTCIDKKISYVICFLIVLIPAAQYLNRANKNIVSIHTRAGTVKTINGEENYLFYKNLENTVKKGSSLLAPSMSGLNFVLKTHSPYFFTQIDTFRPSKKHLEKELKNYQNHPADYAVLSNSDDLMGCDMKNCPVFFGHKNSQKQLEREIYLPSDWVKHTYIPIKALNENHTLWSIRHF